MKKGHRDPSQLSKAAESCKIAVEADETLVVATEFPMVVSHNHYHQFICTTDKANVPLSTTTTSPTYLSIGSGFWYWASHAIVSLWQEYCSYFVRSERAAEGGLRYM